MTSKKKEFICNWNSYINDLLVCEEIFKAAIYDLYGNNLASSHYLFYLKFGELKAILEGLNGPDHLQNGFSVNDISFELCKADGKFGILGQNKELGCSICKSRKLLIIGIHTKDENIEMCNEIIMKLGDFFRENNF